MSSGASPDSDAPNVDFPSRSETRKVTRISREMSNRKVHFFGVYTITNMLDKKITKFQTQKRGNKKIKKG